MSSFVNALPMAEIAEFCRRWKILELAVFGSTLRNDFTPSSDVDILIAFSADADWGLLDHVRMKQELQSLLGRDVDLITRRALESSANWLLRNEILKTAKTVLSVPEEAYAAR